MGSRDREDAGRRHGHRSDEDRGGRRDDSKERSNRDHGRRSYLDSRREHSRDRRERDDDDNRRYQDPKRGRDNLKQGDAGGGERRQSEGKDELPDLYAICRAKVHSIKPFGIFVRLNGYRSHGLVHLSQVSNHEVTQREDSDQVKIQALTAIVGEGEDVWVKIISIKHEEGGVKIGCSLKHVAQSDGRDLDPNNVHGESQDSRPARRAHEKVTLDAVYNVTCTRCGGHGHLKKECYSTGGRVYELLPDENNDPDLDVRKQEGKPENDGLSGILEQVPLPDSVTTVEEAKALLARLKAEKKEKKRHRKEDKHKERKHHKKSKRKSSKH